MSSRNMRLLPWAALRSDSEQEIPDIIKAPPKYGYTQ
jgi:hypothetical protein